MLTAACCLADHGLARLVEAYRAHGHKAAKINPLLPQQPVAHSVPEINMLTGTITGPLNTSGNCYMTAVEGDLQKACRSWDNDNLSSLLPCFITCILYMQGKRH